MMITGRDICPECHPVPCVLQSWLFHNRNVPTTSERVFGVGARDMIAGSFKDSRVFVDAKTGTMYDVATGKCLSSDRLRITR